MGWSVIFMASLPRKRWKPMSEYRKAYVKRHKHKIGHIAKGAFHRWLGKSEDEPITDADIKKGLAAGGHAARMANFARNFGH